MRHTVFAVIGATGLVAAILTPVAQASVPPESAPVERITGADCAWGTEKPQVIPRVDFPAGYTGSRYYQDYPSPYECAIGPSWMPNLLGHPLSASFSV